MVVITQKKYNDKSDKMLYDEKKQTFFSTFCAVFPLWICILDTAMFYKLEGKIPRLTM